MRSARRMTRLRRVFCKTKYSIKPADVDHADDVKVADARQALVDAGAGP